MQIPAVGMCSSLTHKISGEWPLGKFFAAKEHVNTISPVNGTKHPETLWIVLHNLGPSLVLLDTSTGDRIKIFRAIGEKVHGFVQWEGHYIYLNSANGQLCKFTPPGCKSDSVPGKNEILWVG